MKYLKTFENNNKITINVSFDFEQSDIDMIFENIMEYVDDEDRDCFEEEKMRLWIIGQLIYWLVDDTGDGADGSVAPGLINTNIAWKFTDGWSDSTREDFIHECLEKYYEMYPERRESKKFNF